MAGLRWVVLVGCGIALSSAGCKATGEADAASGAAVPRGAAAKDAAQARLPAPGRAKTAGKGDAPTPAKPPPEPRDRATLQVLIRSGGDHILSVRRERAAIFDLLRRIDPQVVKPALPAVRKVEEIPWVEDPEELQKFPARLEEAVSALLPLIAKTSTSADDMLAKVKKMDEENESGKRKHSTRKIEKLEKLGIQHRKLASALGLLLRSLFDEAKVYARYGSRKMRAELRLRLQKFHAKDIAHDRARKAFLALLRELGVETNPSAR